VKLNTFGFCITTCARTFNTFGFRVTACARTFNTLGFCVTTCACTCYTFGFRVTTGSLIIGFLFHDCESFLLIVVRKRRNQPLSERFATVSKT